MPRREGVGFAFKLQVPFGSRGNEIGQEHGDTGDIQNDTLSIGPSIFSSIASCLLAGLPVTQGKSEAKELTGALLNSGF